MVCSVQCANYSSFFAVPAWRYVGHRLEWMGVKVEPAEPNNASPLNADAAGLWSNSTGRWPTLFET
jgi:hypothetical protein